MKLNDDIKARAWILRSFAHGCPTAEGCARFNERADAWSAVLPGGVLPDERWRAEAVAAELGSCVNASDRVGMTTAASRLASHRVADVEGRLVEALLAMRTRAA